MSNNATLDQESHKIGKVLTFLMLVALMMMMMMTMMRMIENVLTIDRMMMGSCLLIGWKLSRLRSMRELGGRGGGACMQERFLWWKQHYSDTNIHFANFNQFFLACQGGLCHKGLMKEKKTLDVQISICFFWMGVKACQYDVGHSLCIITATVAELPLTKPSVLESGPLGDGICNIVWCFIKKRHTTSMSTMSMSTTSCLQCPCSPWGTCIGDRGRGCVAYGNWDRLREFFLRMN